MSENTFLLQAIVSVANLLSPEVASIASMMKVNFCPLSIDWEAEEQITIVNSVMELIETLELPYLKLPQDKLDILVCEAIFFFICFNLLCVCLHTRMHTCACMNKV